MSEKQVRQKYLCLNIFRTSVRVTLKSSLEQKTSLRRFSYYAIKILELMTSKSCSFENMFQ